MESVKKKKKKVHWMLFFFVFVFVFVNSAFIWNKNVLWVHAGEFNIYICVSSGLGLVLQ